MIRRRNTSLRSRRGSPVVGLCLAVVYCCAVPRVFAQAPEINPGGIVNAASYSAQPGIAPGSLVSLFGRNLAAVTVSASSLPLPTTLAGTSVMIGGVAAPLLFVSPTQINLQFPSRLGPAVTLPVVVATAAAESRPEMVSVVPAAVGAFTFDGGRCGRGAILNLNNDGTYSINSPANSAPPGGIISLFVTGLGDVFFGPADGSAATGPASALFPLLASVGFTGGYSASASILYAGRAPGFAGTDQIICGCPTTHLKPALCPSHSGRRAFLVGSVRLFSCQLRVAAARAGTRPPDCGEERCAGGKQQTSRCLDQSQNRRSQPYSTRSRQAGPGSIHSRVLSSEKDVHAGYPRPLRVRPARTPIRWV